jgi:hypothetical protein
VAASAEIRILEVLAQTGAGGFAQVRVVTGGADHAALEKGKLRREVSVLVLAPDHAPGSSALVVKLTL